MLRPFAAELAALSGLGLRPRLLATDMRVLPLATVPLAPNTALLFRSSGPATVPGGVGDTRVRLGPAWDFQGGCTFQPRCVLRRRTHAPGGPCICTSIEGSTDSTGVSICMTGN